MSDNDDCPGSDRSGYTFSCEDCRIDGALLASLEEALDRFETCVSLNHAPNFERIPRGE